MSWYNQVSWYSTFNQHKVPRISIQELAAASINTMASCAVYHRQKLINSSSAKLCKELPNTGRMASSGPALTALLVFAAMSAVLANPYRYPVKDAEEQQFLGEQQWLNAKKQWQSNNAGEQYWPPMRYVDLQRLNANAMYNGMDSALAMQNRAGTQQAGACLVDINVPIIFVGNLRVQVCPRQAGCDRVSVTLGTRVNTAVVVCDRGNQLTGYTIIIIIR